MLFWRKHRAARIIVSLEFHLGTMTPQEMIDFLIQRVGMSSYMFQSISAPLILVLWVCMAPLGLASVPEVNINVVTWLGAGRSDVR